METFINFILQGNTDEFTPQSIVAVIAFCLILDCISAICSSLLKAGGLK